MHPYVTQSPAIPLAKKGVYSSHFIDFASLYIGPKPSPKCSKAKYLKLPQASDPDVPEGADVGVDAGAGEVKAPKVREDLNNFPTLIFFLIHTMGKSPRITK